MVIENLLMKKRNNMSNKRKIEIFTADCHLHRDGCCGEEGSRGVRL